MDIVSLIIMIVGKVTTTSLNLSRKRIERDTLEQKSEGDLQIAKELAPAKIEQADQETKQALLRLTGAKIQSQSVANQSQGANWVLIFFILVLFGSMGVIIYKSNNSNG